MTRGWALSALVAAALLDGGCGEGRGRLVVVVPEPGRVATLDVIVARHAEGTSCGWLAAEVARAEAAAEEDPALDVDAALPEGTGVTRMRVAEPQPLGFFEAGPRLVLVRARGEGCEVLAEGCAEVVVPAGGEADIVVSLEAAAGRQRCPAGRRCDRGLCEPCVAGECCADAECNDGDPGTTDVCAAPAGAFGCFTALDFDGDGVPAPEDCDDRAPEVRPGAERACGFGLDHDCDGAIDDVEGCSRPCGDGAVPTLREVGRFADPNLLFHAVAVSGDRVVAAAEHAASRQAVLWEGRFAAEGPPLVETGRVVLEGTAGLTPRDLALHRETAFLAHGDDVEVVDLSVPGAPARVGRLGLAEDGSTRVCWTCAVSPPLLWVGRLGAADVVELTGLGADATPRHVSTPEGQTVAGARLFGAFGFAFDDRRAYLADGQDRLFCAADNRPGFVRFEECFAATSRDDNPSGAVLGFLQQVAVAGPLEGPRHVYVLGAAVTAPRLHHLVRLVEAGGRLAIDEHVDFDVSAAASRSPPHLAATGDLLLRGAEDGLFAHSASGLAETEPASLALGDEGVLSIALAGARVVVATGGAGLAVVDLDCP